MTTLAVVYARVSSKGQAKEDKWSLSDQESFGVKFFESKGLTNIEVLREKFTGDSKLEDRPEGSRLARLIDEGKVTHLYFKHSDRLFRKAGSAISYIDVLVEKKIQVYIDGIPKDFSRAEDKMMFGFQAVIAANERDSIVRRTAMGIKAKKDKGESYNGFAFGYERVFEGVKKVRLIPHPTEAPILKKMFEMRSEGQSHNKILDFLISNGIPTKRGNSQWQVHTISKILTNDIYLGKARDSAGNVVPSTMYPPIIEVGLWEAAQAVTFGRTGGKNIREANYPLAGILRCGKCGVGYYYRIDTYNGKKKTTASTKYYHSRNRSMFGLPYNTYKDCEAHISMISSELAERACGIAFLTLMIPMSPLSDSLFGSIKKNNKLAEGDLQGVMGRHRNELDEIEVRNKRIVKAVSVDGLEASFFKEEIETLKKRKIEIERMISQIEQSITYGKESLERLKRQFTLELLDEWLKDQRLAYQKSVYFKIAGKDRIEMWTRSPEEMVAYFDPSEPSLLHYTMDDEDLELPLSFFGFDQMYDQLSEGADLAKTLLANPFAKAAFKTRTRQ